MAISVTPTEAPPAMTWPGPGGAVTAVALCGPWGSWASPLPSAGPAPAPEATFPELTAPHVPGRARPWMGASTPGLWPASLSLWTGPRGRRRARPDGPCMPLPSRPAQGGGRRPMPGTGEPSAQPQGARCGGLWGGRVPGTAPWELASAEAASGAECPGRRVPPSLRAAHLGFQDGGEGSSSGGTRGQVQSEPQVCMES